MNQLQTARIYPITNKKKIFCFHRLRRLQRERFRFLRHIAQLLKHYFPSPVSIFLVTKLQVYFKYPFKSSTNLGFDAQNLLFRKPHRKKSQLSFSWRFVNFLLSCDFTLHFQSEMSIHFEPTKGSTTLPTNSSLVNYIILRN